MIVKRFYTLINVINEKCDNFIKLNSYRILTRVIRIILPLYYLITPKKCGVCSSLHKKSPKIIVSLTSFPARMDNLWVVLESLLRQTYKPDKIILWLAYSQFSNIKDINKKVLKMKKRGLEIRFCEDIKSHKKYYYTMKEYEDDIIITVDDDIFQPEDLVENLVKKHNKYPNSIVCYRAHKLTFHGNQIKKYNEWDHLSKGFLGPDLLLMPTTGAGSLFPPNCLDREVFNLDLIKKLCPNADDIWLKSMAYLKSTSVVKVYKSYPYLFTTKGSGETGLAKLNVVREENDIQLKNVMDYYSINFIDND